MSQYEEKEDVLDQLAGWDEEIGWKKHVVPWLQDQFCNDLRVEADLEGGSSLPLRCSA